MSGGSRKRFFISLAGKTNGAHHDFVKKFKGVGFTEVNSPHECDYHLFFCPVASRVGTDISEALNKMPAGKPVILVLMHHTFNRDHVVAESRSLVNNPNVHITVDCLFYQDRFLECNRNDTAWLEVQNYLGVSDSQIYLCITRYCTGSKWVVWGTLMVGTLALYVTAKTLLMLYS